MKYRKSLDEVVIAWRMKEKRNFLRITQLYYRQFPGFKIELKFIGFWEGGVKIFDLDWRNFRLASARYY